MTPQEQQLLQDLTAKINQTVLPDKDPEAAQLITQSLGRNPDALYILAQTVLVQNYALDQAKQQLAQQQAPPPPPQKHTSFLGNLLGMNDEAPPQQPQYAPVNYAPPPQQYAQPPMQYAPPQPMQQQGGFLQSALRTATGVAAGALAFQGIESLMHGFDHHAGYGSGFGNFDGGMNQPREEVTNNYYGDQAQSDKDTGFRDRLSNDLEDRRDDNTRNDSDTASFADSDDSIDDNQPTDDNTTYDPSGNDDSF